MPVSKLVSLADHKASCVMRMEAIEAATFLVQFASSLHGQDLFLVRYVVFENHPGRNSSKFATL